MSSYPFINSSTPHLPAGWTVGLFNSSTFQLQNFNSRERRSAFSLIEVLVATALLVMIVGMIGLVFRQSSMSWDSGVRKAEGASSIRAIIGTIERDLRAAVDAREFGQNQSFKNNELVFVALLEPEKGEDDQRVPTLISYTSGTTVTRTATRLAYNGTSWEKKGAGDKATLLDGGTDDDDSNTKISIKYKCGTSSQKGLPEYVTITADLTTTDAFSGLSVRSYGPDGQPDTRDDILVE